MTTIKDVARKAGVGIATVSRMINRTGYVSADSREKIEQAIQELHYIPNERARNLSKKKTGIIGVIIPDFQTPFYTSFIRQVEIGLYNYGYKTMVCNTVKTSDREKEYVDMLERNIVDGVITCGLEAEEFVYRNVGKPIVSMDHDLGRNIPLICSDHKKGGQILAEYLAEQGCRNVIQLGGYFQTNTPSNDRYEAFQRVMDNHYIPVKILDLEWNHLDYEYYRNRLSGYMEEIRNADGVFASDMGALALYHFALDMGIRVPEELKIVAYDGTYFTRMMKPEVTAVRQDITQIAQKCADTIVRLIRGDENIEYRQIVDVYFQKGDTA